jgi:hypothetical protein
VVSGRTVRLTAGSVSICSDNYSLLAGDENLSCRFDLASFDVLATRIIGLELMFLGVIENIRCVANLLTGWQ